MWKDTCLLGLTLTLNGDWLGDRVARRVGSGKSTLFLRNTWVGLHPLCRSFSRLFLVSNLQEGRVADIGSWVMVLIWTWSLRWRYSLFVWEEELVENLMQLLQPVVLKLDGDCWTWLGNASGLLD